MSDLLELALGEERRAECEKNDRLMGIPARKTEARPDAKSIGLYHPGVSGIHWERPQAQRPRERR
jgi:hypothetical protein